MQLYTTKEERETYTTKIQAGECCSLYRSESGRKGPLSDERVVWGRLEGVIMNRSGV